MLDRLNIVRIDRHDTPRILLIGNYLGNSFVNRVVLECATDVAIVERFMCLIVRCAVPTVDVDCTVGFGECAEGWLADSRNSAKQYYKYTVLHYFYVSKIEKICYNKRRC